MIELPKMFTFETALKYFRSFPDVYEKELEEQKLITQQNLDIMLSDGALEVTRLDSGVIWYKQISNQIKN